MLTLVACTKRDPDEDPKLKILNTTLKDDAHTLDPVAAYDVVSLEIVPAIYETLYQYEYLSSPIRVIPLLAADMPKFSQDRLTVTIPIRRGVRFHDDPAFKDSNGKGRELRAHDLVYSLKRHALPLLRSQGWWLFDGKVAGMTELHDRLNRAEKKDIPYILAEDIPGLKALDDYTLQIQLNRPYPQLLHVLTMSFTAAVAKEAVAAYADADGRYADHPVGTGHFTLKKWERGHRIVLDRNPGPHPEFYPIDGAQKFRERGMLTDAGKALPLVDRVIARVIRERQPEWLGFLKGHHDIIEVQKDFLAQAIQNESELSPELAKKKIQLSIEAGNIIYWVTFNMKDPILGKNKRLRQALSSAIDRKRWIEIFTEGTGAKMSTPVPPGIQDRLDTGTIKYDYDLKRAQRLLADAGYPGGRGLPEFTFDVRGADTTMRQTAEFFVGEFAKIGVRVKPSTNAFNAFLEKAKNANLQIALGNWVLDYPDVENVYQLFYGPNSAPGPNEAGFNHPEFNHLYEAMTVMEPGPARAKLIARMDAILQEEVPWAMGYYYRDYRLAQPWVRNYRGTEWVPSKFKFLGINKGS